MEIAQDYNKNLDDKTFIEESRNLSNTLNLLIKKIQHLISNKPYPDVQPYSVGYDFEDRQDLMYKKQCNYETEQEIQSLTEFQDSPYFARMDFSVLNGQAEYEKIYIGKKGLNIDNQQLVYDWRSPVGQRYYLKSEIEFEHNEYKFSLLLRRALSITKGQLYSYNDEYVYGDEIFKDGITDPFLINALRDKRSEHRLTDIIRTIQENQNNIIRFSARKSFILQGCAGSGKTMIMLHRLSHMIFNNPHSDFSKIKIITPNDNFNIHINDLYTELGLGKIERFKVDDYYVYLLKQYAPEKWKKQPKVISDSILDEQFIRKIYAETFYSDCESRYSFYIKHLFDTLAADKVNEICTNHYLGKSYTCSKSDYDSINNYSNFVSSLLEVNKRNISELERILREINQRRAKIDSEENDVSFRTLVQKYNIEKGRLDNQLKGLDGKSEDCQENCQAICNRYALDFPENKQGDLRSSYEKILSSNADRVNLVNSLIQELFIAETQLHQLMESYQPILNWHTTQEESDDLELQKYRYELNRIPFWRFVAKRQMQVKIQDLEEKLKRNQNSYIEVCEIIKEANIDITKLKVSLKEAKNRVVNPADYTAIKTCLSVEKGICAQRLEIEEQLSKIETKLAEQTQTITKTKNEIEKLNMSADTLKSKILSDQEVALLNEKLRISQSIHYEDIYNETVKVNLDELCQLYKLPKSKGVYRYHLFVELLFWSFWKGKVLSNDRFLNIDEGQDLAATEYSLLRAVNGEDLILNVYGDTNQTITSKGICDWSRIKEIDQVFALNENYRNTEQITEFCNRQLGFSFTSIGVSGTKVSTKSLKNVLTEIEHKIVGTYTNRCAIIVKDYKHVTVEQWLSLGCCQGKIQKGLISLLSVEDSKGLEFEDIYVIDDNMSKNEKYISFTRALETLTIVQR